MDKPAIDGVIFDCDGTLVDSETIANEVLVEHVAEFGLTMPIEEALALFTGGKMSRAVAELERRLGEPLPTDFVPELRERMASAFRHRLKPMPGACQLLEKLEIPFCIASNGPRDKMDVTLQSTGLAGFFPPAKVLSAYEINSWKPDPELFFQAARCLGVMPPRCAVVEDSKPGIDAGLAAGMLVFLLSSDRPSGRLQERVWSVQGLEELVSFFCDGNPGVW